MKWPLLIISLECVLLMGGCHSTKQLEQTTSISSNRHLIGDILCVPVTWEPQIAKWQSLDLDVLESIPPKQKALRIHFDVRDSVAQVDTTKQKQQTDRSVVSAKADNIVEIVIYLLRLVAVTAVIVLLFIVVRMISKRIFH